MTPSKSFISMISANYGILHSVLNEQIPPHWHADVQQDILAEAWLAWPAFRGDCKPSTWLYKIALYKCIDWNRRRRVREAAVYLEPVQESNDWLERLERALTRVQAIDLDLLWLKYVCGLRVVRIAKVTGLGQGQIRKRLYEARKRIRNY